MIITGVESICCGAKIRPAPLTKRSGDKRDICLKCKNLCERFYLAKMNIGLNNKTFNWLDKGRKDEN